MKTLPSLLMAIICWTVTAQPVRTIDGDTFTADVAIWLNTKTRETVRVMWVNTPELHGTTKEAGMVSKEFTRNWLSKGDVQLVTCGRDSFGRLLAGVIRDGVQLSDALIAAGLGVEYSHR